MSLRAEDTGFHTDIRQGQPWLQTRWWFAPSQPNRRWHASRLGRVRALIGRRMTKQARHAGTHEGCESPHASDDARLDLSDHGQALRLSSEEADHRPIGPSPATAQQRVQVSPQRGGSPA